MNNITLCNMCMITAPDGRVLVQHRLPKPSNPWCGLTFPGGHVEPGESIVTSTIREIKEETGLTISHLKNCGYIEWWNPANQSRYMVFMMITNSYTGELKSSEEGLMEWMTLEEMRAGGMAPNMEKYLRVLLEDDVPEAFGISGNELQIIT